MKKATILVAAVLALALSVFLGVAPALADTDTSEEAQAGSTSAKGARFAKLIEREQTVLAQQQERFQVAHQVSAKTQQWLEKLQEQGVDATALQAAWDAYVAEVDAAQQYLDAAAATLEAHAGFDSEWKVIDMAQARATVKEAGKAERQFHLAIVKANVEFRQAVHEYRKGSK